MTKRQRRGESTLLSTQSGAFLGQPEKGIEEAQEANSESNAVDVKDAVEVFVFRIAT
jgi:hypothetical protein